MSAILEEDNLRKAFRTITIGGDAQWDLQNEIVSAIAALRAELDRVKTSNLYHRHLNVYARRQWRELLTELAEWENAKKFVADGCTDEIHCGCVPILKRELDALRAELAAPIIPPDSALLSPEFIRSMEYGAKIIREQEAAIDEAGLVHTCGDCGQELQVVRPGKYQCDNPACPSNVDAL